MINKKIASYYANKTRIVGKNSCRKELFDISTREFSQFLYKYDSFSKTKESKFYEKTLIITSCHPVGGATGAKLMNRGLAFV